MQDATVDRFVKPIAAEVARLVLGQVPQNGSLEKFVGRCKLDAPPVVWELKLAGCEAIACEYLLAVSIVASTIVFTLFFGAATKEDLTDVDRKIARGFREAVGGVNKPAGGTEIIGRLAFRHSEAAWALAKKPR
ncbi:hypothetical protein HYW67_01905 [Candidatus Parcubacteria bacterium]|nr:hypothetical protein [Candidatus Parcubacteria bacterium]